MYDAKYKTHQKLLTWFANTRLGRDYLHIPQSLNRIVQVTPNSITEFLDKENKEILCRSSFYSADNYFDRYLGVGLDILDLVYNFSPNFEETKIGFLNYLGLRSQQSIYLPRVYCSETTFNAIANDADIMVSSIVSWATIKALTSGTVETTLKQVRSGISGGEWVIRRFFCRWTTSALTASATISAVDLKLYVSAVVDGGSTIEIVDSTATDGALVSGDFDNLDLVQANSFSGKDITTISTTQYNTWSLNAGGIANVSKTANSLFAFTTSADTQNIDPNPNDNSITIQQSGDANPEQLVVTYTVPATGAFLAFL